MYNFQIPQDEDISEKREETDPNFSVRKLIILSWEHSFFLKFKSTCCNFNEGMYLLEKCHLVGNDYTKNILFNQFAKDIQKCLIKSRAKQLKMKKYQIKKVNVVIAKCQWKHEIRKFWQNCFDNSKGRD